jgi:hypothetical protein
MILGLFAGSARRSPKLIDKFGVKIILAFGFIVSIAGGLFWLSYHRRPKPFYVLIGLALMAPAWALPWHAADYMMLSTRRKRIQLLLATLSLLPPSHIHRPAIMVGFWPTPAY